MGTRDDEGDGDMVRYSLFLRRTQLVRMRAIHKEHGVPVAAQIRRAIDAALASARKGPRR